MIHRPSAASPDHIVESMATLADVAAFTIDRRFSRNSPRLRDLGEPRIRDRIGTGYPDVRRLLLRNALITNGAVRQRSLSDFLR